jgi:hypothetical protein
VLESRAILEIVDGRLKIIEKFEQMVLDKVPETASSTSLDNMHDLLAGYPWLLNPEWQVFAEERKISRWVMEKAEVDLKDKYTVEEMRQRFDFLAMSSGSKRILVEIIADSRTVRPLIGPVAYGSRSGQTSCGRLGC